MIALILDEEAWDVNGATMALDWEAMGLVSSSRGDNDGNRWRGCTTGVTAIGATAKLGVG